MSNGLVESKVMVLGLAKVHLNYFFFFLNDTIIYFSIACFGNIFDLVLMDINGT